MAFWNKNEPKETKEEKRMRLQREAELAKEALLKEADNRDRQLKSEILKSKHGIQTVEFKMERKLSEAVAKAVRAKNMGDKNGLKNAYVDIKMAMRFKAVAAGAYSAMDRLESNLEFAGIGRSMVHTLEKAGELTKQNESINIGKIDTLYQKVMDPLDNVVSMMEQFGQMNVDGPLANMDISDEEVENVIKQVMGGQKVFAPAVDLPVMEPEKTVQPAAPQPQENKDEGGDTVDNMLKELNGLLGLFNK